jgi:hypothetical protein
MTLTFDELRKGKAVRNWIAREIPTLVREKGLAACMPYVKENQTCKVKYDTESETVLCVLR